MPTYEYACKSCGEHLEVVQSFKDEPLTTCPSCAGELRKVFSPIGITFKGSGFYKTDSRSGSKSSAKSGAGRSESSSSETGGSSSGSSDSSSSKSEPAKSEPAKKSDSSSTSAAAS